LIVCAPSADKIRFCFAQKRTTFFVESDKFIKYHFTFKR